MRGLSSFILHALDLRLVLLLQPHLHPLTELLGQFTIALLAHWLSVPCSEVSVFKGTVARAALEMMLVIRLVQELLRALKDGFLTDVTGVAEELVVVHLAIGLTVVLPILRLGEHRIANVA